MKKLILIIMFMLLIVSCSNSSNDKEVINIHLRLGKPYYFIHDNGTRFEITYCGIINDKVFSISGKRYRDGYNIYYPIEEKQIWLYRGNSSILFTVVQLTPDMLWLIQLK